VKAAAVALTRRPPPAKIVIKPGEWCSRWEDKPDRDVAFGLRLPSDDDESRVRREATDSAGERFKGTGDLEAATDEYNDAAMALLVGACVCDPNDLRNEPEQLHHPQDTIRHALRSETIRRLYHEIERLKVEESPASIEADEADVVALGDILLDGLPPWLTPLAAARCRRHIRYLLDELIDT